MKVIYKYPLSQVEAVSKLAIPEGAEILSMQLQQNTNTPTLWALVDPERAEQLRKFVVVMTGESPPDPGKYLGTFQADGGFFMGHVYEIT